MTVNEITTALRKALTPIAKRVHKSYVSSAVICLNTLVLFVLLNLCLFGIILVRDVLYSSDANDPEAQNPQQIVISKPGQLFNPDGSPVNNGKRTSYELKYFDFGACEEIGAEYAAEVLTDFYDLSNLGFIYQPWVEFSEPPFNGQRVNVDLDPRGFPFRRTANPANDRHLPVVRILTLGGSTTFGYHVSDEHTWPSHLSRILNDRAKAEGLEIHVDVVNYGRAYYNSSQETVLMVDLLKSGHRPSAVLFMDGFNRTLSPDVPYYTPRIARAMRDMQFPNSLQSFEWLPVVRLANSINRRWFQKDVNPDEDETTNVPPDPHRVDHIVNAFEQNRHIASRIAKLYGIEPLFFLQPHVADYNLKLLRRPLGSASLQRLPEVKPYYMRLRAKAEWIDLSGLFPIWGNQRKAIIDDCHYSPAFNEFLAKHVAEHINLRAIKPRPALIEEAAASGEPKRVRIRDAELLR